MSNSWQPEFTLPIQGEHVSRALATARLDPDAFRQSEMKWLEQHHALLWLHNQKVFERVIRGRGIEAGEAFMAGTTLGHNAVRLCADEGHDYETAIRSFRENRLQDEKYAAQGEEPWNSPDKLDQVFGNSVLTAALMEIRHDGARDAAAISIGFLCLAKLPVPTPLDHAAETLAAKAV